ncbi:unnamed protein product [Prorocentrum cordatum]|uniref:Uncharacterized protein n=1 Tax=Prorocentrum cordatum TaxID=2364126 RepID=A0ABN9XCW9_9DINO|nr:unnamed protein product [Polarella glacialis]
MATPHRPPMNADGRGMIVMSFHWDGLFMELLLKQSSMRGGLAEEAEGQLFDARASCSHSAAGIVRLMARWLASRQQTPALHAAADGGLVFSMVAGLGHEGDAAEALAPRRMALSVAAVQEWRASAQTFRPPLEVEDQLGPDAALESAPCGAFCAALRPLQVPLAELRPLVPVICIAWGEAAGAALQAMTVQRPAGAAIAASGSSAAQGCGRRPPQALPPALAGHSDSIQLIDNVQLDVVTGKAVFLAHAGALRGPGASQALVLLLDASRGMRAVSALAPASSLRRCSH